MKIKVLISEDHELFRDGLRLLLGEAFTEVEVLESSDFTTTKCILEAKRDISLVLFDINIPGTSGLDGLKEIKTLYPALPLVVISALDSRYGIQQMLQLGADGFITKTSPREAMIQALKDIEKGELVIVTDNPGGEPLPITPRQIETLSSMSQGMTNKEIAKALNISPATAKEHVSGILSLLGCENRTQAVMKSRDLGIIIS